MGAFADDLRGAVGTLRRIWWLLPTAVAVAAAGAGLGALSTAVPALALLWLLVLPFWLLVELGWLGTERVVFARDLHAEELHVRNVWGSVQILGPRFVRLGLLVAPTLLPAAGAMLAWGPTDVRARLVLVATAIALYATLTFVTPALALSTDRARSAVRIGTRLLRNAWPGVAAHVLVPAVALGATFLVPPDTTTAAWPVAVVHVLVAVLARGATTRRYVHLVDVDWPRVAGAVWRRRVSTEVA